MTESEEKNDDKLLLRLPASLKKQAEAAAKLDGNSLQEWIRKAIRHRLGLKNICPKCGTVNTGNAKFCNECGESLKYSQRSMAQAWFMSSIKDELMDLNNGEEMYAMLEKYFANSDGAEVTYSKQGGWTIRTEVITKTVDEDTKSNEGE